jgi:hypothetical protein
MNRGSEMPEIGTRPRTAEQWALRRTTSDHRDGSAGLETEAFAFWQSQESAGIPIFASRETSGRSFCALQDVLPTLIFVLAGTLDDPAAFKPTMDVYWSSVQPWIRTGGDRTRFPKMPN